MNYIYLPVLFKVMILRKGHEFNYDLGDESMISFHERSLAFVFLKRQLKPEEVNLFISLGIFTGPVFVPSRIYSLIRGDVHLGRRGASVSWGVYSFSRIEQLQGSSLSTAVIVFDILNFDCLLRLSGMLTTTGKIMILTPAVGDCYETYLRRIALQQGVNILDFDPDGFFENSSLVSFAANYFSGCGRTESDSEESDALSGYYADGYPDNGDYQEKFLPNASRNEYGCDKLSERQRLFLEIVIRDYFPREDFRLLLTGPRGSGKTFAVKQLLKMVFQNEFCGAESEIPGILFGVSGILNKCYGIPGIISVTRENYHELSNIVTFLVIEEALSLPTEILREILDNYHRVLMVSTDDGYEGSGQGFRHITMRELSVDVIEFTERFRHCYDRVSEFFRKILCLPDFIAIGNGEAFDDSWPTYTSEEIRREFCLLEIQELRRDGMLFVLCRMSSLLRSHFTINAVSEIIHRYHYESSPQDLVRWLRDPKVQVLMSFDVGDAEMKICSLLIFRKEGRLSEDLVRDIYNGERLPPGNLLPQTLLSHAGISCAGYFGYFRIERIITIPEYRRRKHASSLLSCLTERTGIQELDDAEIIGTSFAFKPDTYSFWRANGFAMVYAGISPDTASGLVSAVCLKGTDKLSSSVVRKMREKFFSDLPLREIRFPLPDFWHELYESDTPQCCGADDLGKYDIQSTLRGKWGVFYSQTVVDKIVEFLMNERCIAADNLYQALLSLWGRFIGVHTPGFTPDQIEAINISPDIELVTSCARNHHSIGHALPDIMRFILLKRDYLLENTTTEDLKSLLMYLLATPDADMTAVFGSAGGRKPFFRRVRQLLTELLG